jgi:hypothetical protein
MVAIGPVDRRTHMASPMRDKRRVDALFKVLSSDFLLREQFVTDPAQILNEYVSGTRLKSDHAAAANQLVYAVVSNPRLLAWLQGYARSNAEVPAGDDFIRDFARALARDGDEQTLIAVMRAANDKQNLFTVQADVLRRLISALQRAGGSTFAGTGEVFRGPEVFAGTEMSSPGTEISPGHGTDVDPGGGGTELSSSDVIRSPQVFAGTEMSSPGTEISPGHGTEMSPGRVFGDEDVSVGTEMSSPGTEISPGHGTEMSPGQFGGIDIDVTLKALVDFATQLRQSGALDAVRFR